MAERDRSVTILLFVHFTVVLDPRNSQAAYSAPIHCSLPIDQLLHAERITVTGFFEGQQPASNGCHDFSLSSGGPSAGA
jgi:hypothetical protein